MSWARLALPAIRLIDPERAHRATIRALAWGIGPRNTTAPDPRLGCEVFGLRFPTPIGLAAGFDKDAEAVRACRNLGFGFVEIGTVTPRPQPGNPKPRLFRLSQDRAVINRMGFNNGGAARAAQRLSGLDRSRLLPPIGVNIGKNKDSDDAVADYRTCAETLAPYADYLTVNVSSPNTPGLRDLQTADWLARIVEAVDDATRSVTTPKPILVKVAPDLDTRGEEEVSSIAQHPAVSGIIISNTTVARPDTLVSRHRGEAGGLSGAPLFRPSTDLLARIYRRTEGKIPLIGVGGVASARDAYEKIRAGASLVQLYSAMVYHGPDLIPTITAGLSDLLDRDGYGSIAEAVGSGAGNG
ncbi:MAG: quinone-dependent dihydroorotate dehydrogenase [Alphaproteobacteria bacterium]